MSNSSLPQPLARDLRKAGLEGSWHCEAATIPADKGAYALVLRLDTQLEATRPAASSTALLPGWYIYGGSARGSGGLRARLQRHFKRHKPQHWHIDQLTPNAAMLTALVISEGDECDLVSRLSASYAFDVAIPGFGSTDCRLCPSHLLTWRPPEMWRPS
ncbi:MAG: GIY-YIG nuclease family protein [Hyphomicrobiales bacterium]|nr:GIY-YIG nuclease family protein [Hyphomicrobiales bacterium]